MPTPSPAGAARLCDSFYGSSCFCAAALRPSEVTAPSPPPPSIIIFESLPQRSLLLLLPFAFHPQTHRASRRRRRLGWTDTALDFLMVIREQQSGRYANNCEDFHAVLSPEISFQILSNSSNLLVSHRSVP